MEHAQQQSISRWLAYDSLELAVERGRRVPLTSKLPVGERKGAANTTSSYRGGVETADLPVEDPSLGGLRLTSESGRGGCLSGR
jgi:hypothetical protein